MNRSTTPTQPVCHMPLAQRSASAVAIVRPAVVAGGGSSAAAPARHATPQKSTLVYQVQRAQLASPRFGRELFVPKSRLRPGAGRSASPAVGQVIVQGQATTPVVGGPGGPRVLTAASSHERFRVGSVSRGSAAATAAVRAPRSSAVGTTTPSPVAAGTTAARPPKQKQLKPTLLYATGCGGAEAASPEKPGAQMSTAPSTSAGSSQHSLSSDGTSLQAMPSKDEMSPQQLPVASSLLPRALATTPRSPPAPNSVPGTVFGQVPSFAQPQPLPLPTTTTASKSPRRPPLACSPNAGLPALLLLPRPSTGRKSGTSRFSPSPRPVVTVCRGVSRGTSSVRELSPWTEGIKMIQCKMHQFWPSAKRSASTTETLADERKLKQLASEWFRKIDRDDNGVLSHDELAEGMRYLNNELCIGDFSDREVARCMRRFDTNSDGTLSEDEFHQVYRQVLLAKLNDEEPTPFNRDMFLGIRLGDPRDHYEICDVLGKGSFGVVRKLLCNESKAARVLKSVDKKLAKTNGLTPEKVMEEIDKLKALDHPAVLRMFEYYTDSQALHLVTDHLPGGDLSQAVEDSHLNDTPLAEDWVRTVFHQVCQGIAYCHGQGVMHRDLKLDNIMLGSMNPPQAIIIDMGLAELFPPNEADSHRTSAPTGSIPIMAPEVFTRSSSCKCDVWSLGCCLFGLLCKTPLWIQSRSGGKHVYPYPFAPPKSKTHPELQEYLRRQRSGPDLLNMSCTLEGSGARHLISLMLQCSDQARPDMKQVLGHRWLKNSAAASQATFKPKELECLANFLRSSALEEVMLLNVASQMPLAELDELRALFRSLDLDDSGRLEAIELVAGLQRAGWGISEAQEAAKKLTRLGPVEFSRFVAALLPSKEELLMPYLRDAFNRLDLDGDGYITTQEFRELLAGNLKHTTNISQTVDTMLEGLGDSMQRVSFEDLSAHMGGICV